MTTGLRNWMMPWTSIAAVVLGSAACGGSPEADTMQEGVAAPLDRRAADNPDAGQRSDAPSAARCAAAAQGCQCISGQIVECVGPKIQSGNYTSCPPGRRACTDGVWGPCVGKTVYGHSGAIPE